MRVSRHYNTALGREVYGNRDYLKAMKEMKLCPSDSPDAQPNKYERKEYKPSSWAHGMVRAIERQTDKDGKVHLSSGVIDQLQSSLKAVPKDLQKLKDNAKGGFF